MASQPTRLPSDLRRERRACACGSQSVFTLKPSLLSMYASRSGMAPDFERRLAAYGLVLYEPAGQDGRSCQWLAASHQLERVGALWCPMPPARLEAESASWLAAHASDVLQCGDPHGGQACTTLLSTSMTSDEFDAIVACRGLGDHNSLHCMLCMLKTEYNLDVAAHVFDARTTDSRSYDTIVSPHPIYSKGKLPQLLLYLAFIAEGHPGWHVTRRRAREGAGVGCGCARVVIERARAASRRRPGWPPRAQNP